jgi:selenocysteine-specific elongation factor
MIIGTAGHIDHGKTALVQALTGIDTDRLPEEKRRGITIELGFAPLHLEGAGTAGVVDVPGHEAFVRTMVAGASGIDLALLVVAADEGVMPQTREHLEILRLLGTRGGVVAITKSDLVDAEWLELVRADVERAASGTPLEGAPVVATSVVSGHGLDQLRQALVTAAAGLPGRDADDRFRMPVDRVFTVRGTGTVVTGTVWTGRLEVDATAVLQPAGRQVRVRGIQVHGHDAHGVGPATRAAVALSGVEVPDVARGTWLLDAADWPTTLVMRSEVRLVAGARPPRPREWLRLHIGTADVGARVVVADGKLALGAVCAARIVLQEPVIARAGDRFVLRRSEGTQVVTVGGGRVVDPLPARRRARPWPVETRHPAELLRLMLNEAALQGLERHVLPLRLGVQERDVDAVLRDAPGVVVIGKLVFAAAGLDDLAADLRRVIGEFHRQHALEDGMPLAELRRRVQANPALLERALETLAGAGDIEVRGTLVAERLWRPRLTASQVALRRLILEAIRAAGVEPPLVSAMSDQHHSDLLPLARSLEREGLLVAVEQDRFYSAEAVERLVGRLRESMAAGREYSPTELREVLGVSRKYLIPFLEYCDRMRLTERRATGRVWHRS